MSYAHLGRGWFLIKETGFLFYEIEPTSRFIVRSVRRYEVRNLGHLKLCTFSKKRHPTFLDDLTPVISEQIDPRSAEWHEEKVKRKDILLGCLVRLCVSQRTWSTVCVRKAGR